MIKTLRLSEALLKPFGLNDSAPLDRLADLVVLTGPNGGGKTRFLGLVQRVVESSRRPNDATFRRQLQDAEKQLADAEAYAAAVTGDKRAALRNLRQAREQVESQRWAVSFEAAASGALEPNAPGELPQQVVPLNYRHVANMQQHARDLTPQQLGNADNVSSGGFDSAVNTAVLYLARLAQDLCYAGHPSWSESEPVRVGTADAVAFNAILKELLGLELSYEIETTGTPQPTFGGRPLNTTELSAGQRTLLCWAILLHRQRASLSGALLLIDEPELSLHPDACVRAIDGLRRLVGPQGQLWIATHSIPLLAYAGIRNVWFVEGGRISYAGNKMATAIERLTGGEEGRDQLRAFLAEADALAFFQFAAECLRTPSVASHDTADPQETMFVGSAVAERTSGEQLRLLDYGAGRGRLAAALREFWSRTPNEHRPAEVKYTALCLESVPADERGECEGNLADLEKLTGVRTSRIASTATADAESYDVVVMCNVLHEIPATEWAAILSDVARVLQPQGALLLLEDQRPTIGELPHPDGFVLLDLAELQVLVGGDDGVTLIASEREGRLTAHELSVAALRRVTLGSVRLALEALQERSLRRISELRTADASSFQAGREHGLVTMLYANATLTLRALSQ